MRWILLLLAALAVRSLASELAFRADRGRLLPDEARYLAASRELPDARGLPPGYPALLAAERGVSESLVWLRFCGALLGALSCLAVAPLLRAAVPEASPGLAWAAAWAAALSPLCAASSSWLLSESLYVPLLVLAGWGASRRTPGGAFAAGGILLAAQLVRPLALPLLGLAVLWHGAAGRRREALALLLGAWLACLPLGALLGAPRLGGALLPLSRLSYTWTQSWSSLNRTGHAVRGQDLPADPAAVGRSGRTEEPLRLAARKLWGLWRPVPRTTQLRTGGLAWASLGAWLLTVPAALVGAGRALRHWRVSGWLLIVPLATTGIHLALTTSLRYRLPAEPCMAVLAVWGWAWLFRSRSAAVSGG